MELKDILGKRIERYILEVSILLLILSFGLSACIYLNGSLKSLKNNLAFLEEAETKIERLKSFLAHCERYNVGYENSLAFARFLDSISAKIKDPQMSISGQKISEKEKSFSLLIKGEARFSEILDLLRIMEDQKYPVAFVKSYAIRKSDKPSLQYEVMSEIIVLTGDQIAKSR
ncbi:MAG: hypothetical protein N2513_06790 [Deltaproteobacteria bacterium]|nr:hypothetical protein [Deltaproteobacteria bacterium]